jgi:hypothetical protein
MNLFCLPITASRFGNDGLYIYTECIFRNHNHNYIKGRKGEKLTGHQKNYFLKIKEIDHDKARLIFYRCLVREMAIPHYVMVPANQLKIQLIFEMFAI